MESRKLRRFVRTRKGLTLGVIVALMALGVAYEGWRLVIPELLGAVVTAVVIDGVILRFRKRRWVFPDGALLTGLFIGMILSPRVPWYAAAATSTVAVVSKYLVRVRTANVFNPAALGLVATFYIFNTGQSWWGALPELPPIGLAVLIGAGLYTAERVNKLPAVLAFLGTYFLLATIAAFAGDPGHVAVLYRAPDLHAALFFSFFMVSDPPTSPPLARDQLVYSVITAVAAYAAFELIGAAYFLLAGVLVANIWEAWRRHRRS